MQVQNDLYLLPTDDLAREQGCYIDLTLPTKIRAFIEGYCIQSKAPFNGKPVKLMQWQVALLNTLYGSRRADGSLRFRRAIIYIPKKQGKSTLLAALNLWHLLQGGGQECFCLAATRDQASIVYSQCCDFVENHKSLSQRLWLRKHIKTIEDSKTKSLLKVLSSDGTGKSGFNANFIVCDELAEWPKHSAREVWDRLQDAGAARQDSLLVTISTAQFDRTSIGYEQYKRAKNILDGRDTDTGTLPVIYEVDENEDWKDSSLWWKALPSADVTVPKSYYLDAYKAIEGNPLEETRFRTLLLNQWVGSPEQWIPSTSWQGCISSRPESATYGQAAIIGIDYARRYDLCAYCVVVKQDDLYYVYPRYFIPREVAKEKEQQDNVPYTRWANDPKSNLILTDGDVVDPSRMRERIKHDAGCWRIQEVRYDPYGMEESRQILEAQGYNAISVPQTAQSMGPAFNHFESLVKDQKLRHPDNAILNWNLGNCRPKLDKKDRLLIEKASDIQRIDGIDATCIALTHWLDTSGAAPVLPQGQQWAMVW